MYRDVEGPAEDILDAMSRKIPVHMVFGDIPDTMYVPPLSSFRASVPS